MRDAAIVGMQNDNARRSALLLNQFEFLQTRLEAMERVMRVSKLSDRIKWAFDPSIMLAVVDAVQINLLDQARKQYEDAKEKAAVKAKLQVFR